MTEIISNKSISLRLFSKKKQSPSKNSLPTQQQGDAVVNLQFFRCTVGLLDARRDAAFNLIWRYAGTWFRRILGCDNGIQGTMSWRVFFFFEVRMWGLFLLEHFYFTCMLRWFRRPTAKCTYMLYLMTLLVFLWITWACKRYFQRKDDHFFICSTGSSSLKPNHTTPCFVIKNPQKCTALKCQEW